MLENPFLTYGYEGPEYFCDRKHETEALLNALRNGCNVTLLSPRRYGKTGLIHNAFHYLQMEQANASCFYIDIYPTKSLSDFVQMLGRAVIGALDSPLQRAEGFLQRFFHSAQLSLGLDPLTGLPQVGLGFQPQQAQQTLEEIFAYISQSERMCIIALDEFQQVSEYPEKNVEELLRAYVQRTHNVHFIFSGSKLHMMDEMFSSPRHPFYRSTERIPLDVLPESVYFQWASEKLSVKKLSLGEDVFHRLYQEVDGVTWYMQAVLNRLYRLPLTTSITDADVDRIIRDIILGEEDSYKRQLHLLTLLQGRLLTAVAKEGLVRTPTSGQFIRTYQLNSVSSVQRALAYLQEQEYIYRSEEGYIVYDRFFGKWLRSR